ncbi:SUR1 [Candida margitis]|uniref:SUR1 n=1 Tax=Candida margitis TaxID=1775924 RepID=UPI00222762F1|nr:SUR1 [Candida margitis]KAI5970520.1 SUR1 [Candida margitis]
MISPSPQSNFSTNSSNLLSIKAIVGATTTSNASPMSQPDYTVPVLPSISPSIPESKLAEMLERGISSESPILTHGYVHGHIHKHKNHTHIHGHIHNHDHDHHYRQTQNLLAPDFSSSTLQNGAVSSSSLDTFCPEFKDVATCKDVFCDDLDDCFYLACDDSKFINDGNCCQVGVEEDGKMCCTDSNCVPLLETQKCCNDVNCVPILKSQRGYEGLHCDQYNSKEDTSKENIVLCCDDPKCNDYKVCHSSPNGASDYHRSSCHHAQGTLPESEKNNLCDLQIAKRPLFEDLISNVHQNLSSQESIANDLGPNPPAAKKTKRNPSNDFEIHFPHECHPEDAKESTYHHHIHQSCFHTTIPNDPDSVYNDEKLMSDFDFIIKFNNFHDMMNKKSALTVPSKSDDANSLLQYPCQWEHCLKKLNNDNFMNHIVGDHIKQEHDLQRTTSYQCEWNNCNYTDENLDALLQHLESHKQSDNTDPAIIVNSPNVLTPVSTASVNTNEKSPSAVKSPTTTKSPASIKHELNITSMSILPKKKKSKDSSKAACCAQGPEFKCQWEVGIDQDGKPIPCNATHESQCGLQHHIINDHIGSGKSKYSCNWVGCERHNGKIFNQRQKLYRHIHIHTNYKPCKCSICGASFAVQSMLDQHLRIHSGEKPFQCTTCGKRFATSSSLSIHNRVHTGEKPLKCKWPGCNKSFSESSNLTKHMKIHEREFACVKCGESFAKKADLDQHSESHRDHDVKEPKMDKNRGVWKEKVEAVK